MTRSEVLSSLSLPRPHSSPTFLWRHVTSTLSLRRARRERLLLYILRASPRTVLQDVLLSRACTDAALTSTVREHTHTYTLCSSSPPHSSYPYSASPGIISQMFQSSGMLHLRAPGISAIKNICTWGISPEYFNKNLIDRLKKSSNGCRVV